MKRYILLILFLFSTLHAGIPTAQEYLGPTKQLIKRESWKKIQKKLKKMKIPKKLFPFFDAIAGQEDWGHIGYHGTNQSFRIYQDIIRFTIEEIVGLKVRDDFHFFRVPGDSDLNLNNMDEFCQYWGNKINNKDPLRAKQLLSLNYGIYSNFDVKGSCSLNLFVKDKSKHEVDYTKQLTPFFEELGLNPSEIKKLFAVAYAWLDKNGGVLLKLEEESHTHDPNQEAYNFTDQQGYPCKKAGYPFGNYPVSNHFERIMTDLYTDRELKISPQLRLLLNNSKTLNPNSCLSVKRWDLYDAQTIRHYENDLREAIQNLEFDKEKVENYRSQLMELWKCDH